MQIMEIRKAQEKFVSHLSKIGRPKNTSLAYSIDIEQMVDFFESSDIYNLMQVEAVLVEDFIKSLSNSNYTVKTISRKINSIKTFFKFLNLEGYLKSNPSEGLKHQKIELKAPRILSKLEYRSLRDAARKDVRTFAMVEILIQTGIRISELAEIKMNELNLEGNNPKLSIPFRNSIPAREVPLNKAAVEAINNYLQERPKVKSDYLFITKSGNTILIRNIRSTIDKYFKEAGVENAKVNDLRHTFVSFHIHNGMNLLTLSKISGHKRLSTTEKYLNYIEAPKISDKEDLAIL
jgi:site-specific recombinase XerD